MFDYIKRFCNPKRRHNSSGGLSPITASETDNGERLLRKVELRQHEAAVKILTDQLEIEKTRNAELTATLHKIIPISRTGTNKAESQLLPGSIVMRLSLHL